MVLLLVVFTLNASAALRVPGFTAYFDPRPDGARISTRAGVTGWRDPSIRISWFGQFQATGEVNAVIEMRLPEKMESQLRLTVAGQSRGVTMDGAGTNLVMVRFGSFEIREAGYQRFVLESLNATGQSAGDIETLVLDGPATAEAQFNLKPRRNAASVHLNYPVGKGTNVAAFYCELTGLEEPVATYYEACGWHRGYFGMQINSATERRIIFSVWDSGGEAISRSKVQDENRVLLVAKGAGVSTGDFGNEGTGGHSHLVYNWKRGVKQRFLVTAQPTNATFTIYTGWWYQPEEKKWNLVSSWRAPKDGSWMRGLYSFSENFGGATGHLRRKALYGNQWIRTDAGEWIELTTASFSCDATGRSDRLDRFMGIEDGQFFLSHGGFVPGFTKSGERFTRPAIGTPPKDVNLRALLIE